MKFKVGNLVRLNRNLPWYEEGPTSLGEVIDINPKDETVKVKWPGATFWELPEELQLVETPIERMRRLYSES